MKIRRFNKGAGDQFQAQILTDDEGMMTVSIVESAGSEYVMLKVGGYGQVLLPAVPEALREVIKGLQGTIEELESRQSKP